jgi:hypothetical protein
MLSSDQTPATFWIRNPQQYFRHNHAAGSSDFGFWFDTFGPAQKLEIPEFFNNTAHSNGNSGVWVDFTDPIDGCLAPDTWVIEGGHRSVGGPSCPWAKRKNTDMKSTTTWGNGLGIGSNEGGHLHWLNHRSYADGMGITFIGVQSDNWPDETNGWYGPMLLRSVYHAKHVLAEGPGFNTTCTMGGPWDDTLFLLDVHFDGEVAGGHFCPCTACNGMEGGYEIRTKNLFWHNGAGSDLASGPMALVLCFLLFRL